MMITKVVLVMMVSLIFSVLIGLVLIPFLRKLKFGQRLSEYLERTHSEKQGTPTMGGLIFIIPTILSILILLIWNKIEFSSNLFIVMFVFLSYALLGFIDDYLIIK